MPLRIKTLLLAMLCALVFPIVALADGPPMTSTIDWLAEDVPPIVETVFEARVVKELDRKEQTDPMGQSQTFQKLKLIGLTGEFKDKEFVFDGIERGLATREVYGGGERVYVTHYDDVLTGDEGFQIGDTIRYDKLYFLAALFVAVVLLALRRKGLTALLGLGFTFLVIIKFIIPQIVKGGDPLLVTIPASLVILLFSLSITHGVNKKTAVAIAGTFSGVVLVGVLSILVTSFLGLSGYVSEETMYLTMFLTEGFSAKNLLLAGFILGALGVLDDIAITQVSTVKELKEANRELGRLQLYKRAMKVGVDHNASMINTLFLAYSGAAISLLVLISFRQPPFETITQVLNHEVLATEIVRTLVGSIGIVLTIPITTLLAAHFFSGPPPTDVEAEPSKEKALSR
jgi:uncharacterized membrane protein